MNFSDIPKFPISRYKIDVPWSYLEHTLDGYAQDENKLQLCPDFQRGHVWTEPQQTAFIEYQLQGGESGRDIWLNHPGWMDSFKGDFVLIDGLQRLTAIRKFVANDLKAFNQFAKDFGPRLPSLEYDIKINITKLKTRAEVLKFYLAFNSGGTIHSKEELNRVQDLLRLEP